MTVRPSSSTTTPAFATPVSPPGSNQTNTPSASSCSVSVGSSCAIARSVPRNAAVARGRRLHHLLTRRWRRLLLPLAPAAEVAGAANYRFAHVGAHEEPAPPHVPRYA